MVTKFQWSMRYVHIPLMYSVVSNLLPILFSKPFLFFITINVSYICESFFFRLLNLVKYVCTMYISTFYILNYYSFTPFQIKKNHNYLFGICSTKTEPVEGGCWWFLFLYPICVQKVNLARKMASL